MGLKMFRFDRFKLGIQKLISNAHRLGLLHHGDDEVSLPGSSGPLKGH